MDHFFEESAANVFARLVAVDALLAELYVLGCRAAQTVQSVGKEESALLQDSRTDVKYVKVVLKGLLKNHQTVIRSIPRECVSLALSFNYTM